MFQFYTLVSVICSPLLTECLNINHQTQFKNLETNGERAHFALQKAALPAAAALTAVTGALGLAAKAAAEDEQQQVLLATAMSNTVAATDAQVKATEDMIGAFCRATGTADSELRPAFA